MDFIYNGQKDPVALKNIIGDTIKKLIEEDPKVVYLDCDVMNCINTGKLPETTDRAIQCGISEANMIGVACGMSAVGFKPLAHSFGPFVSRRVFDQVFLSGGYAGLSITVLGADPGVTAGFNGGTHMPFEDMALYRAIPGAVVADITDGAMLKALFKLFLNTKGVKYIRTSRKEFYPVYPDNYEFKIGQGAVLREGKDLTIVACGIMVHEALEAAKALSASGIEAAVIDPITVKPLDAELVRRYTEKTGALITAENHNRIGGLTSAVQDAVCGLPCKFGCVAVDDCFGEVGAIPYLQERFGLTAEHIVSVAKELLGK